MRVFPILIASSALLVASSTAPEASACATCSCRPKQPRVARDSAQGVFSGRVIALSDRPVPSPDTSLRGAARRDAEIAYLGRADERLRVTIEVYRVWKGAFGTQADVYTANECCICGFAFELGKEYLVYAYRPRSGRLHTSICSRTRAIAQAEADLEALGPGMPPDSAGADSARPPQN